MAGDTNGKVKAKRRSPAQMQAARTSALVEAFGTLSPSALAALARGLASEHSESAEYLLMKLSDGFAQANERASRISV